MALPISLYQNFNTRKQYVNCNSQMILNKSPSQEPDFFFIFFQVHCFHMNFDLFFVVISVSCVVLCIFHKNIYICVKVIVLLE